MPTSELVLVVWKTVESYEQYVCMYVDLCVTYVCHDEVALVVGWFVWCSLFGHLWPTPTPTNRELEHKIIQARVLLNWSTFMCTWSTFSLNRRNENGTPSSSFFFFFLSFFLSFFLLLCFFFFFFFFFFFLNLRLRLSAVARVCWLLIGWLVDLLLPECSL